jgi:hypothetical protein
MLNTSANDNSQNNAFVIETADTAAGVIVRQANGYRFFAADHQFNLLDGSIFKSPKAAQQAADLMWRAAARDLAAAQRFGNGQDRDGRPAEPRRDRA